MQRTKEVTHLQDKADAHSKALLALRPGERVWIQHHQTKEWYKQATIVESRHSGRAYELVDDDGKTEEDASSAQYIIPKDREKPQSCGATQTGQKKLLTQPWSQSSQRTPPFCPATSQSTQLRNTQMSMSTFGFIAHALRPSTTTTENQNTQMSMSTFGFIAHALRPSTTTTENQNTPRESPQTVTGNIYSIFKARPKGQASSKMESAPTRGN